MAPPPKLPKHQTPWRIGPVRYPLTLWPDLPETTVLVPQYDYPLPTQPYRSDTYAQSYSTPRTLIAPAGAPLGQNDWPLPKQLPYQLPHWTHTNLALGVPVVVPFNQDDWPRVVQPPRVYAQSYSSPLPLIGVVP